jgi:hypothetical protein
MIKRFLVYLLAIILVFSTAQSALASGRYYALDFSEGLAAVCMDYKWGYVDASGNVVIPYQYEWAESFSDGVARVESEESGVFSSIYIDKTGKTVEPPTKTDSGGVEATDPQYSEELKRVQNDDSTWSYIDETGKTVLSGLAYYKVGDFHDGRAVAVGLPGEDDYYDGVDDGGGRRVNQFNLKFGYIDKTGKLVIPTIYNYLDGIGGNALGDFNEGLARVYLDWEPMYIDVDGNIIISDLHDCATSFKDGIALSFRNEELIILKNPLTSGASTPPVTLPAPIAKPTASTVLVNGKAVAFDAYNISDNNYFKLRDLAFVLTGSEKQFDVAWDAANNAISLASGKPYTPVGGEMEGKGAGNKTPNATTSKITLDGKEVSFTAYNIEGNNYFKLRDVAAALDFGVTWDGAAQRILVDTGTGYTPE